MGVAEAGGFRRFGRGYVAPMVSRRHTLLLVAGIAAVVVAAAWYLLGRPSGRERRTEEVSCAMRGVESCSLPEGPVAGPIVLAVAGAFLILLGVILLSGRRDAPSLGARH